MNWNQFQAAVKRAYNNESDNEAKEAQWCLFKVNKTTSMSQKYIITQAYIIHKDKAN